MPSSTIGVGEPEKLPAVLELPWLLVIASTCVPALLPGAIHSIEAASSNPTAIWGSCVGAAGGEEYVLPTHPLFEVALSLDSIEPTTSPAAPS